VSFQKTRQHVVSEMDRLETRTKSRTSWEFQNIVRWVQFHVAMLANL